MDVNGRESHPDKVKDLVRMFLSGLAGSFRDSPAQEIISAIYFDRDDLSSVLWLQPFPYSVINLLTPGDNFSLINLENHWLHFSSPSNLHAKLATGTNSIRLGDFFLVAISSTQCNRVEW